MHLGDIEFNIQEIPEAFASHFNEKVTNITEQCIIDPEVYRLLFTSGGLYITIIWNKTFFLFYPCFFHFCLKMRQKMKNIKSVKKHILTSNQGVKHLLAGQNIQHLNSLYLVV